MLGLHERHTHQAAAPSQAALPFQAAVPFRAAVPPCLRTVLASLVCKREQKKERVRGAHAPGGGPIPGGGPPMPSKHLHW